jgi:hypothetical protein
MGKLRGALRLPAMLGVIALVAMSLATVAIADNLLADGDGLTPVDGNNSSLGFGSVSCNADTSKNVALAVSRNGGAGGTNVFKDGSTVTVSAPSVSGTGASAVSVSFPTTGNTIALPSDWGAQANNTLSSSVTARVTIHPTTTGSGSPTITFRGSGKNSDDAAINRDDTINASWSVSSCAAPDTTAPTSTGTAKNADNSDYTFGDWTKQNVTVTLLGQDTGGSGLKEIRYTTDGTDPTASTGTVYSGAFTISAEGSTTLKWRAIDNASPANLEAIHTETVKIDKVAPTISCGAADGNWHAADVSIACTASDTRSGVSPASDASFNLSTNVPAGTETNNAQTGTKQVSDAAGNTATAGPIGGNKVDKKAPGFSCDSPDTAWHGADVSLNCTSSDGGSGLANAGDASFSLSTNVPAGTETATAQTGSRELKDAVGNTSTAGPLGPNKIDKKAPGVSCGSADGDWHANDVTIACTANDGGSGIAAADQAFNLSTNVAAGTETANAQTNSRDVTDGAGNTSTAGPIGGNKVDKKAPGFSCDSPDTAWHGSDVSFACTSSDGGSGLANAGDASFSLSTNVSIGTETATAQTGSRELKDAVGNASTAGPLGPNKIDKKAPWISCGTADGLWHADNVSIGCAASDGGSGIPAADQSFNLSTNVAAGAEDANASTNSRDVTDAVGNKSTAGAIGGNKIDRKAPSVSCGSADGLWHADNVSIACSASDGGSGLAQAGDASFSLSTNVAAGAENSNASTNSRNVSDGVGHTTAAGPISGNKIDRKGPTITCATPPTFTVGQSPANVTGTASDGGSGVQGSTSLSSPADTSSVVGNPKSVLLSAKDNVDNVTNQNCTYNVLYGFAGFFQPVDNNGVFNKAKAGSAIPVKFSLDGPPQPGSNTPGLADAPSAFLEAPTSVLATCPTATSLIDLIEELSADSVSGLHYDPTADQWVYVWKTTTNLANSCRQLKVKLADGTTRTANFQFTK